jgi:glycerol-3-phosphate dehydrogenase (NAD(P)+)
MAVITILGAGVMGSAMILPARDKGHEVRLIGTLPRPAGIRAST